jgi:two-component system nitrate/nitrite sensor histidine kinase NarX
MLQRLAHKPILTSIGVLMAVLVSLAIVSMLSSVVIARTLQGMGAAINQSGSLRMQSYRIAAALADESVPASERAARAGALAREFEERLASPRLAQAIPGWREDHTALAYARVVHLWEAEMRPPLMDQIRLLEAGAQGSAGKAAARAHYLSAVDAFVGEIDALVRMLEVVAERRVDVLRLIQGIALVLTVLIALVTMTLMVSRVIRPLGELLRCADKARTGDFSGRTHHVGGDELGRLGAALNLMAEGLSQIYGALEQRVAEKTQDLARTNRSLELLYHATSTLNEGPASEPLLRELLGTTQQQLATGPLTLCLGDEEGGRGTRMVTTRPPGDPCPCWEQGCRACTDCSRAGELTLDLSGGGSRRILSFPVGDRERHFGVLLVDLAGEDAPAAWQQRLLATLAGHVGTALTLQQRMRESRRLALHEERGIIARELHDSLAQSLSYLKIQVTRLAAALEGPDPQLPRTILGELREGTNSAYRQLRELLTTFRLKMDDRGLNRALEETVQEFRTRGAVDIALDNRLPAGLLTPNEEIHVLQIVREALSNVVRHAGAREARVQLHRAGSELLVEVADDGRGIGANPERPHHYGMTIMRERTLSLGGEIRLETPSTGGTRVRLRFPVRGAERADPAPRALLGAES